MGVGINSSQSKGKRGFTLIELIVVMAVLAVLILLAMLNLGDYSEKAIITRLKSDAKVIQNASEEYYIDNGEYPFLLDNNGSRVLASGVEEYNILHKVEGFDESEIGFFEIDFNKLEPYLKIHSDTRHFIAAVGTPEFGITVVDFKGEERIDLTQIDMLVNSGFHYSLALMKDGTVWAWGRNTSGQLGNGESGEGVKECEPVRVLCGEQNDSSGYLTNIVSISAGNDHSLALSDDGDVFAWGDNTSGQLGNGESGEGVKECEPVRVLCSEQTGELLTGITSISAWGGYSLALSDDGYVFAWGRNNWGQLGNGESGEGECSNIPARVKSGVQNDPSGYLTNITSVSAGGNHSLALSEDGYVFAWGYNKYSGALGNGNTMSQPEPVQVLCGAQEGSGEFLTGIIAISAGGCHSLALSADGGKVYAWGNKGKGQLGIGDTGGTGDWETKPVQVLRDEQTGELLTGITSISAGSEHSLAISNDGDVVAWGSNYWGQLGNGEGEHFLIEPIPVQVLCDVQNDPSGYLTNITSVSAGGGHSLALSNDGDVFAWGLNTGGQIGNGGSSGIVCNPVQIELNLDNE